jgi:hypothetical protein
LLVVSIVATRKNTPIRFVCYFYFVHNHGIMHVLNPKFIFIKPYFIAKTILLFLF